MYLSAIVHYKNKYPDSQIFYDEDKVDVYDKEGRYVVALRKRAGRWVCTSQEMGCRDVHNLSPIPKNTRVWKLYPPTSEAPNGRIGPSEEADERKKIADELMDNFKIPAIEELVPHGLKFDHNWSAEVQKRRKKEA